MKNHRSNTDGSEQDHIDNCSIRFTTSSLPKIVNGIITIDEPESTHSKYAHYYSYSGANKAGMDNIDKNKQSQIIYEMSKNSAYFKRAAKLDEETDLKIESMRMKVNEVHGIIEEKLKAKVESIVFELECKRNFDSICVVLDMDMFYAAVEIRDQPHLKELPVAVGSYEMISTANYVARKYGVRAAMPGFIAKKLCPQLIFVPCNFEKYQIVSNQIRSVIAEYDPNYSSHSLDEVYFDLTSYATNQLLNKQNQQLFQPSTLPLLNKDKRENHVVNLLELRSISFDILQSIRTKIFETTNGLTASAGIANNFMLAKICADINKPNGQYELPPTRDSILEFMNNLPTRKVGGIGKVTERILNKLFTVSTMGQVRELLPQIYHSCTPQLGQFLIRASYGISTEEIENQNLPHKDTIMSGNIARKSLGCERTFSAKGIQNLSEIFERLADICSHIAKDLQDEFLWAKTLTVKMKTIEFELITRSYTNKTSYFQSTEDILRLAKQVVLQQCFPLRTAIRLLGVQVSKFANNHHGSTIDQRLHGSTENIMKFLSSSEHQISSEPNMIDNSNPAFPNTYSLNPLTLTEKAAVLEESEIVPATMSSSLSSSSVNKRKLVSSQPSLSSLFKAISDEQAQQVCNLRTNPDTTTTTTIVTSKDINICPICNLPISGFLYNINQHIDICLSLSSTANEDSMDGNKQHNSFTFQPPHKKIPLNASVTTTKLSSSRSSSSSNGNIKQQISDYFSR